jgi:hypothetical protein
MNALDRRVRRLETKLVPPVDVEGMRRVALPLDRRRRCLAADGREAQDAPCRQDTDDFGPRPQTLAEALQAGDSGARGLADNVPHQAAEPGAAAQLSQQPLDGEGTR